MNPETWTGHRIHVSRREASELGIPAPMLWDIRLHRFDNGVIGSALFVVRES